MAHLTSRFKRVLAAQRKRSPRSAAVRTVAGRICAMLRRHATDFRKSVRDGRTTLVELRKQLAAELKKPSPDKTAIRDLRAMTGALEKQIAEWQRSLQSIEDEIAVFC